MIIYLIPLSLLAIWLFIAFSGKKECGWSELERFFKMSCSALRKTDPIDGIYMKGIGRFNYQRAIRRESIKVSIVGEGIVITRLLNPLFLGFSPLFIPWLALSTFTVKEHPISDINLLNQSLRSHITRSSFKGQSAILTFNEIQDLSIEIPWNDGFSDRVPNCLLEKLSQNGNLSGE